MLKAHLHARIHPRQLLKTSFKFRARVQLRIQQWIEHCKNAPKLAGTSQNNLIKTAHCHTFKADRVERKDVDRQIQPSIAQEVFYGDPRVQWVRNNFFGAIMKDQSPLIALAVGESKLDVQMLARRQEDLEADELLCQTEPVLVVVWRQRNLAVLPHHKNGTFHIFIVCFLDRLALNFTLFQRVFACNGEDFDRRPALKCKFKH